MRAGLATRAPHARILERGRPRAQRIPRSQVDGLAPAAAGVRFLTGRQATDAPLARDHLEHDGPLLAWHADM